MDSILNSVLQQDSRIPVTILTGFLGSGKTTLLNRILSEQHGMRIAVIENEFGEIGIDSALVVNAEEEIFEMSNGCICCTVRGDLIRILTGLMRRRDRFDYILVETTGLADPAPVIQTFFMDSDMQGRFRLDGVVTVVDSKHVWQHLDTSDECREQLAFGDVVILNKTDLVDPESLVTLKSRIVSMNRLCTIIEAQHANVPLENVLHVKAFDLEARALLSPELLVEELPFEWMGAFELQAGTYQLRMGAGPDPTMQILLAPIAGTTDVCLEQAKSDALHAYSGIQTKCAVNVTIKPSLSVKTLELYSGNSEFTIDVGSPQIYGLFTQHHPSEFELVLMQGNNKIVPVVSRDFPKSHEHDIAVGSLGIDVEGDVDELKFDTWISLLLREKGTDIFRMKGILNMRDNENQMVFQGVHMIFESTQHRPWGTQPRRNQLVFIGRSLNHEELRKGFMQCLA